MLTSYISKFFDYTVRNKEKLLMINKNFVHIITSYGINQSIAVKLCAKAPKSINYWRFAPIINSFGGTTDVGDEPFLAHPPDLWFF
jgi:hypothetical protein